MGFFCYIKDYLGLFLLGFFQDFKDDYFLKKLTFGKCKSMQCIYLKILARKAYKRKEVKNHFGEKFQIFFKVKENFFTLYYV